ncbi:MAG: hypothetical protein M3443_19350 [Actinomycetota bacterium]|nr:hypothetical protein [Actinomycetota bacterium]
MSTFRRTASIIALTAALGFATGCSAADPAPDPASTTASTAPQTKAGGPGTGPQESPEKLYAEFVTRLSKVDGPGVCALFTKEGAVAYEDEFETAPCDLVPTKAASKIEDLDAFGKNLTPKTNVKDSDTVVELTGCGVGAMKALKSDKGWLIDAYLNPAAVPGC